MGSEGLKFTRISEALNLAPSIVHASGDWRSDADDAMRLGGFFKLKRVIDLVGAGALLLALITTADVNSRIYWCLSMSGDTNDFWQQRKSAKTGVGFSSTSFARATRLTISTA